MTQTMSQQIVRCKVVAPVTLFSKGKRAATTEDPLPAARIRKRHTQYKALFVNDFETICAGMCDLSYQEPATTVPSTFDALLTAFGDLDVRKPTTTWAPKSLREILDRSWYEHMSTNDKNSSSVRRAIKLSHDAGIYTFRDLLWYNDSLTSSAPMRKFPNCLVDISYGLLEWAPRRSKPEATLEEWQNAWRAITLAWPIIMSTLPKAARKFINRRYPCPPESVNWFYFDYFDGVWNAKEPLLCYHENESTHSDAGDSLNLNLDSEGASLKNQFTSELDEYSDEDPRRESDSDSDED